MLMGLPGAPTYAFERCYTACVATSLPMPHAPVATCSTCSLPLTVLTCAHAHCARVRHKILNYGR
eukprot:3930073-Pleurochrysis_carterae.AAC.1